MLKGSEDLIEMPEVGKDLNGIRPGNLFHDYLECRIRVNGKKLIRRHSLLAAGAQFFSNRVETDKTNFLEAPLRNMLSSPLG